MLWRLGYYGLSEMATDLFPGNVGRELRKVYTAFSACRGDEHAFDIIVTGLWVAAPLVGTDTLE